MPSLPYREARHFLFAMDYTSKRWKHLRARVLREQPLCQEALRYGRREPATVAHHVYPVEDFPGGRFCRWNLSAHRDEIPTAEAPARESHRGRESCCARQRSPR